MIFFYKDKNQIVQYVMKNIVRVKLKSNESGFVEVREFGNSIQNWVLSFS